MSSKEVSRNVVLGVTGSIAAYKSAEFARMLVKRGYNVRTVMTDSAMKFISPLTFQSITGRPVYSSMWDEGSGAGMGHIELADWADLVAVVPATADCIAKMASGFAESTLLATLLATKAPVLIAPAMNVNMYNNAVTQQNLSILRERGVRVVDPDEGSLACGWNGRGRLADPWEIFYEALRCLSHRDLEGRKVLITTGPTREPIDPVRFISNRSSGKMGVALAREAYKRGAEVILVHGPVKVKVPRDISSVPVVSAREMHESVMGHVESDNCPDVVIMAAAVADFRPEKEAKAKIKKSDSPTSLPLDRNPDILKELGQRRGDETRPVLVGFAVETGEVDEMLDEVRRKLESKQADIVVGNFANESFELDTNRVWIVTRTGKQDEVAMTYKSRIANRILDTILKLW